MSLLMGIDIGTSACKVAIFRLDGHVVAQQSKEYPVFYPKAGWAEQNPEDWWEAVCKATRQLLEQSEIDPAEIVGIGIDGQSWSAIPISQDGRVLHNTPIWMDTRSEEICLELEQRIKTEKLFEMSGNPLKPSYTLPKILWYKKHLPEVYDKAYKILQSNSYIAYKLTGEFTQDLSQGYGLSCFNMRKGSWDYEICEEIGIRKELLPEIVACHQIIGGVSLQAASEIGLVAGIPVVAGGLDAACGTLGAGVIADGQTQEQGGQAGGMSCCSSEYKSDPRLILSFHVVPNHWLLQGGTVGGGGVVNWLEKEIGCEERASAKSNGTNSFYEMDKLAEKVPAGSEGLIFLPYMAGERSPIWNPDAKGVYFGLDYSKTRAHIIRASLEGVAYSLRHNLEAAKQAGARADLLSAMGGAANSKLWTQIKADVTQKPIEVPSSDTATTLGAAILAGVAVGAYKSFEDAVAQTVRVKEYYKPNPDNFEIYNKNYQKYIQLYQKLEPLMDKGE